MSDYSFILQIADIPIKFICQSATDMDFLGKKYKEYFIDIKKCRNIKSKVYLEKGEKRELTVRGDAFYLRLPSLSRNFVSFNIFFRRVIFYLINRNNGFILHASSLVQDDTGHIFTGRAGSGKSTIRKLFPEFVSLGDDSAVVRRIKNKYFLFGSPFYQRTKMVYPNIKVSIRAIYKINKSSLNKLHTLLFPEGVKAIMGNAFLSFLGNYEEEKAELMKTVFQFCLINDIYDLNFKKERSVLALINHD